MKKGCVIAAIVVLVLALIGIGGCVFFGVKYGPKFANASTIFALETAIDEYRKQNPDAQIEPTNEAWAAALQGAKLPGSTTDLSALIKDGKLVDLMQKELKLDQAPDGSIKLTSPGSDGVIGTEDDVTSDMITDLTEKAEGTK